MFVKWKRKPISKVNDNIALYPGINHIRMEYHHFNRKFIVHLPSNYQKESTYPVVMAFHGRGGTNTFGTGTMGPLVNRENFIGIYPQGIYNTWNTGYREVASTENDVGFILAILDWLEKRVNIDKDRIYTMGYSNGGTISYRLVLETDKFAAMAALSASFFEGQVIHPDVPKLSVMQIHGELDTVVPYYGGRSTALIVSFESARHTVELWANHNGIGEGVEIHNHEERLTVYSYKKESNPFEVVLYCLWETTHDIGQHWFFNTNRCFSVIWEFFERHSKNDR
jgi:polyhydroxybutyrate depolymerase